MIARRGPRTAAEILAEMFAEDADALILSPENLAIKSAAVDGIPARAPGADPRPAVPPAPAVFGPPCIKRGPKPRPVVCVDRPDWGVFESARAAENHMRGQGVTREVNIHGACKYGVSTCGYHWAYYDERDKPRTYRPRRNNFGVVNMETGAIWINFAEAFRGTRPKHGFSFSAEGIRQAVYEESINGGQYTSGGYRWRRAMGDEFAAADKAEAWGRPGFVKDLRAGKAVKRAARRRWEKAHNERRAACGAAN